MRKKNAQQMHRNLRNRITTNLFLTEFPLCSKQVLLSIISAAPADSVVTTPRVSKQRSDGCLGHAHPSPERNPKNWNLRK